jgi:hypothetical protein
MAAGYINLYIEQGSTYSTTITIDDVTGSAYNLTSYTANSQIRKSYYQANATAKFATQIDSNTGTITLTLDAPTTANIPAGRYVYDTILRSGGSVIRILEGIAEISPSVSR